MAPNWFIAIPVALDLTLECLAPPASVRLFAPEDLHLTVCFLGAVDQARALSAFEAARDFRQEVREVTLSHVVALGSAKSPSALSALLDSGRAQVEEAIGKVRDGVCDAAGVARDVRPPLAHITLARIRRSAGPEERSVALQWASQLPVRGLCTQLSRLALYTWSADRSRTQFRRVCERAL